MPALASLPPAYAFRYTSSYFRLRHSLSMNRLSVYRPLPPMLTLIPCCSRSPVKAWLVNWAPRSVLNISGWLFLKASSRAATQKSVSRVLDSRQANTYRLYQSMMATRYRKPRAIGMQVMSALQTWLGWVISTPPSRYGYTWWLGAGWLVL